MLACRLEASKHGQVDRRGPPARRMLGADFAAPERLFQLLDGSAMDILGERRALDRGAPQAHIVCRLIAALATCCMQAYPPLP